MKKSFLTILLLSCVLIISSCGKEVLTPIVSPMTINEIIDNQPIRFSYKLDQTEIEEFAKDLKIFPIVGRIFQTMIYVLVNSTIQTKKGHELKMEPFELDLNLDILQDIDMDKVEYIKFDSIEALVDRAKKNDSLEFIDKIELYAIVDNDFQGIQRGSDGLVKLVSYNRKIHPLGCDNKCLSLRIEDINWKDLIQTNSRIRIVPVLLINSVPKSTMKLAGSVSFSIKLNLGF